MNNNKHDVVFCFTGQDFTPKSISCRLVFLTAYLTAVILLSAYSAALISFLTKKSVVMPFRDLQGLLKDGTYRLGIMPDSAEYEMFEVRNKAVIIYPCNVVGSGSYVRINSELLLSYLHWQNIIKYN
jgi:hypothetical protein